MATICRRFLISGRVQGVFYRGSAQRQATELGLRGWVRNLADGRVECLASGDAAGLDTFEKWLEIGPDYAKVTNIEVITVDPEVLPSSFEVLSTTSTSQPGCQ